MAENKQEIEIMAYNKAVSIAPLLENNTIHGAHLKNIKTMTFASLVPLDWLKAAAQGKTIDPAKANEAITKTIKENLISIRKQETFSVITESLVEEIGEISSKILADKIENNGDITGGVIKAKAQISANAVIHVANKLGMR